MPKIELTLEAKVDGVLKALEGVGRKIDALDQGKTKFKPIDAASVDAEGQKVVQTVQRTNQKIVTSHHHTQQQINNITGSRPGQGGNIPGWRTGSYDPGKAAADIAAAAARAAARAAGGGVGAGSGSAAGDGSGSAGGSGGSAGGSDEAIRRRIRTRYTYAPEAGEIGRSFIGGVGGGFAHVAGYAQRGATAGAAEGGGMAGGALGLLRGGLIGAAVLGAMKLGQGVSEGYDMAGERAHTLDTLKRQMGDVGVSFDRLKISSEAAASGLAINSKDFAAVEATLHSAAGRATESSPLRLAAAANLTSGFARAYGMDPNQTSALFGNARNVDPKRSYMEFAGILAQTMERTGKAGSAEEVTQAVLSFASTASRLSLSQANISGYAGAYAGLTNMGLPGLTSEASAGLLAQANSAASNMGAAGEAGQAFTLAAFNRSGPRLNPLDTMAEASGGLFGSRSSVFAQGGAMARLIGDDAARKRGGSYTDASGTLHEGDTRTNFDMIKEQAERTAGGKGPEAKELQAEMLQRYYGLQSIQQSAALMEMKPEEMKNFDAVLKRGGVEAKDFNATNIQTVAKIAGATSSGQLDDIYADLKTRTGTSALSDEDKSNIDAARKSGDMGKYQDALVHATATKDYAQDSYTVQQQMSAKLDDIKTAIGDTLLGGVTKLETAIITQMGGREKFDKQLKVDAEYQHAQAVDAKKADIRRAWDAPLRYGEMSDEARATLKAAQDRHVPSADEYLAMEKGEKVPAAAKAPPSHPPTLLPEMTVIVNVHNLDEHGSVKTKTSKQKQRVTASGAPGNQGT